MVSELFIFIFLFIYMWAGYIIISDIKILIHPKDSKGGSKIVLEDSFTVKYILSLIVFLPITLIALFSLFAIWITINAFDIAKVVNNKLNKNNIVKYIKCKIRKIMNKKIL